MLNMVIRWFFVVFLLLMLGCNNGNTVNEGTTVKKGYTETENVARAIKRLDAASRWMIENGIMEILTNSSYGDKFHRVLIDEFSSTGNASKLKNEDDLARFIIKNYSIHYDINLLKRNSYNGLVYEYWMIFKDGPPQRFQQNCRFLITLSDSIKSHRTILKESGQFFHQYKEGDAVVINLDYENDLSMRYILEAWTVPHCYENYKHITQQKIRAMGPVGSGNYSIVP